MARRRRGQYLERTRRKKESAPTRPAQDLTEENAQLVLGEKANHLASAAAQALPFVPYHPEELRQRGHRQRPGTQRRCACWRPSLPIVHLISTLCWGMRSAMPTQRSLCALRCC